MLATLATDHETDLVRDAIQHLGQCILSNDTLCALARTQASRETYLSVNHWSRGLGVALVLHTGVAIVNGASPSHLVTPLQLVGIQRYAGATDQCLPHYAAESLSTFRFVTMHPPVVDRIEDVFGRGATVGAFTCVVGILVLGVGTGSLLTCVSSVYLVRGIKALLKSD